jgi:hypothetical protein
VLNRITGPCAVLASFGPAPYTTGWIVFWNTEASHLREGTAAQREGLAVQEADSASMCFHSPPIAQAHPGTCWCRTCAQQPGRRRSEALQKRRLHAITANTEAQQQARRILPVQSQLALRLSQHFAATITNITPEAGAAHQVSPSAGRTLAGSSPRDSCAAAGQLQGRGMANSRGAEQ